MLLSPQIQERLEKVWERLQQYEKMQFVKKWSDQRLSQIDLDVLCVEGLEGIVTNLERSEK